jgi:Putative zinc-finger
MKSEQMIINQAKETLPSTSRKHPCPSIQMLLGYLFHAIRREHREEFEAHLSSCPRCHQMMEGMRIGIETFYEDDADAKAGMI